MDCKTNYETKCKALSEFYALAAANSDRLFEFKYATAGWCVPTGSAANGPDLGSDLSRWRVKQNPAKAWVWWRDNFCPVTFLTKEAAETWKREHMNNEGIIMEITKPD